MLCITISSLHRDDHGSDTTYCSDTERVSGSNLCYFIGAEGFLNLKSHFCKSVCRIGKEGVVADFEQHRLECWSFVAEPQPIRRVIPDEELSLYRTKQTLLRHEEKQVGVRHAQSFMLSHIETHTLQVPCSRYDQRSSDAPSWQPVETFERWHCGLPNMLAKCTPR